MDFFVQTHVDAKVHPVAVSRRPGRGPGYCPVRVVHVQLPLAANQWTLQPLLGVYRLEVGVIPQNDLRNEQLPAPKKVAVSDTIRR